MNDNDGQDFSDNKDKGKGKAISSPMGDPYKDPTDNPSQDNNINNIKNKIASLEKAVFIDYPEEKKKLIDN